MDLGFISCLISPQMNTACLGACLQGRQTALSHAQAISFSPPCGLGGGGCPSSIKARCLSIFCLPSCTWKVEDATRREVKEGENQLLLSLCLCWIPVSASRGQGSTCSELVSVSSGLWPPLEPHQPRFLLLEMEPVFRRERKQRCCASPFPWLRSLLVAMWQCWRCLSGFFQEAGASPCLILHHRAKEGFGDG